jgi:hypothetical protein
MPLRHVEIREGVVRRRRRLIQEIEIDEEGKHTYMRACTGLWKRLQFVVVCLLVCCVTD